MKILVFFAVGALFGVVSCYESYGACFNREYEKRVKQFNERNDSLNDTCSTLKAQAECAYEAAMECDMGFIQEAYKVKKLLDNSCANDNDDWKNYRRCYGRAVGDGHCIKRIYENIKGFTLKDLLEGQRENCMQVDWFKRCMVTNVEDNCGGVSEDYFSYFLDPLVALHKRICREVILATDENVSIYTVFGLPSVFEMIIQLFTKV